MSLDEKYKEYEDNRKIVVARDKGEKSEYRGNNNSEKLVAKYRVDGGLIKDGAKCDYLLLDKNESRAYFIESGKAEDIIDREYQMIRNEKIDSVSCIINEGYDFLYNLEEE